ncbi:MAG TPA: hypothetical protein VJN43_12525 [Bryobacteraceae bacterium]|nr:hypothetical protein [Bryobacteraceae bacterium]
MRKINHLVIAIAVSVTGAFAHHAHHPMAIHEHNSEMAHHPVAVSARLANNPVLASQLSSRLVPLLPAGTNIQTAAVGFKNLGQFVAAVHVAHNLNIPFIQLAAKMTGPNAESLGKAIEDLRPNLGSSAVKQDVKLAKHQAKQDLEESSEAADRDDQAATVPQQH